MVPPSHPFHVPDYCWPFPLWHVNDIHDHDLYEPKIRIDGITADGGYMVTVSRAASVDLPDLFIMPEYTPPMNTDESVDIWVDSSCNGYEADVGPWASNTAAGGRHGHRDG